MLATKKRRITLADFKPNQKAIESVNAILQNGQLSYGSFTKEFERRFAEMHDCEFAIFSNSGTSALQIALQALKEIHGWNDGDEVIVPATTFVATINIILHNRMKPVFVDIHPGTYNIHTGLIPGAITPRTRAIIPVHLLGLPADMEDIHDIATQWGLKVIEDSCEAIFTRQRNRTSASVGAWGDVGCFSTYMMHHITAGIGGMCTTNRRDLADKMRSLMNHGRDLSYFGPDSREKIDNRYKFTSVGHSFRATELEAAIGLSQLDDLDWQILKRRKNARYLTRRLEDLPIQPPEFMSSMHEWRDNHTFLLYPIVLKKGSKKDLIYFLEDNGIDTRDIMPILNQPIYKTEGDFPTSKNLIDNGFCVGVHQYLDESDMDYIADAIKRFYDR